MVKVIAQDGKFKVEGTFDFGYAGLYRDGQISLNTGYGEIREWECVGDALDTATCTDDEIASFPTAHINELEQKVQSNIKALNDDFLLSVFSDMEGPAIEFWEHEQLTVPEFMPQVDDPEEYYSVYDSASAAVQDYFKRCREAKQEGRVETTDVEALLRQNMPMFNWDNFLKSIVPEYLDFNDESLSFQCSDNLGGVILCGAWCEFDEDLNATDWHNF